jgi:HlyD family secretion protein
MSGRGSVAAAAGSSESIFRRAAIERLSSPDQLDRLITLTSPIGWAAVVALLVLLAAIVGWSIFGSVATRVSGAGIFVSGGDRVFDAMAPAAGTLASVAAVGTEVAKGQVVAVLDDMQAPGLARDSSAVRRSASWPRRRA